MKAAHNYFDVIGYARGRRRGEMSDAQTPGDEERFELASYGAIIVGA